MKERHRMPQGVEDNQPSRHGARFLLTYDYQDGLCEGLCDEAIRVLFQLEHQLLWPAGPYVKR
jgi:hypothetical protein